MLLVGTGRRSPAPPERVLEGPVWRDEAVAQVPREEPEGVVRRVLLESAVPYRHRRCICWGSQGSRVRQGHGLRGACSQGGPQGGQGGQPRGDGPLLGRTASPRGRSGCLLIAVCVVGRLGRGAPGVWGVPRGPPCPPLEDVGGRLLVVYRGCSVHCVPRQVFPHYAAFVVLVCTQGAFRWFCGPSRREERHRLSDGALRRWFEGQVGQWNRVWRQSAARGRHIKGSCRGRGPETPDGIALCVCLQPRLPVRGADSAVRFAPPVRIRAFDCTLVGKHMCSMEGVLGSNPTTPKMLPKVFVARWRLLRNAPSKGYHSRYITLFFKCTYRAMGFYELMRMFLVSFMHFLG